jgi:hypothetical protein
MQSCDPWQSISHLIPRFILGLAKLKLIDLLKNEKHLKFCHHTNSPNFHQITRIMPNLHGMLELDYHAANALQVYRFTSLLSWIVSDPSFARFSLETGLLLLVH